MKLSVNRPQRNRECPRPSLGPARLALGLSAAISVTLLSACGSTRPTATAGQTGVGGSSGVRHRSGVADSHRSAFAGYKLEPWTVTMIAGSWRVPRITLASGPGFGSTWIGAQQPDGGNTPFIQVGTTDYRDHQDDDYYDAFWSDTARHFRPVTLFRVAPGDRISAMLTLSDHTWKVELIDRTLHTRRVITTRQETSTVPGQAEWFQEDPSKTRSTTAHLKYASTSPVHFTDLMVNGTTAPASFLIAQSMTLPHTNLAPTTPSNNSFTIHATTARARPSAQP
jgi:hypothetical protein